MTANAEKFCSLYILRIKIIGVKKHGKKKTKKKSGKNDAGCLLIIKCEHVDGIKGAANDDDVEPHLSPARHLSRKTKKINKNVC